MQLFVKLLDGRTRGSWWSERTVPLVKELAVSEGVRVEDQLIRAGGRSMTAPRRTMRRCTAARRCTWRCGCAVGCLWRRWSSCGAQDDFWLGTRLVELSFGRCWGGKRHCKTADEETDSDGSSYDDVSESSSDDDDDEAKKKRKEGA